MRIGRQDRDDGFRCIDRAIGERVALHAARLLEPAEARRVEAHVAACDACAADDRAMRALLGALESVEPEDLERAALEPDSPWVVRVRSSLLPSVGTMLVVAGVVVALAVTVAWQRARDHAVVSEVRLLRAQLARLEQQGQALLAASPGEPAARPAVAAVAGIRFVGPPNF